MSIARNVFVDKDYIYIEDLVEQCCALSVTDAVGAYNIGSGRGTPLNEILELIRQVTSRELNVEYIPQKTYDVSRFVLDTTKARECLMDIHLTALDAGVEKLWQWILSEF